MQREREPWRGVLPTGLGLLVIAGLFHAWQTGSRKGGGRTPVESGISMIVAPPRALGVGVIDGIGDFGRGVFGGPRLSRENEALRARLLALETYTETISRLEQEVDGLRRLNGMADLPGRKRVYADVRGYAALENTITVGAGSAEGVKKGMPVVAPAGLLGIVMSVSGHECTARLVTSAASTLGALAPAHDPPPAGLIRGENAATLSLTFSDPNAPIKMGDLIVTTGYSELVPRGIAIGKVIQIEDSPELGSRTARVYPAAQIGRVREVAILK